MTGEPRRSGTSSRHQFPPPVYVEYGELPIATREELPDTRGTMKPDTVAHIAAGASACCGVLVAVLVSSLLLSRPPSVAFPTHSGTSGDSTSLVAHLEDSVPLLQERYGVPGVAILLVQGGEISWSGTFGDANRESGEALTDAHVLMTHSISKSVTARGIIQLAQAGKIDLDTPVQEYLGPAPYGEVTVRQLLSNTSGLPLGPIGVHFDPAQLVPDTADYLADLAGDSTGGSAVVPSGVPGQRFAYSNTGFAVLERVVRETTGRTFADFMRDTVLQPLGMDDSTFSWQPDLAGRVPFGYDLRGVPVAPFLYPNQAPGGLFATLHDLGRFLAGSINDPMEELYQPQVPINGIYRAVADSYGLGHFLETLPRGERAVFHGGQGLGWMTHFHALPDRGEGIVIITNSQRSWPLIATVLRDWSVWTGAGPVGMSRILTATHILGVVVVLLALAGAVLGVRGLRVVMGARPAGCVKDTADRNPGRVRIQPRVRPRSRAIQGAELLGTGAITLLLLWALRQDYLFVPSVFPTLARPLGISLTMLAVGLALVAGCGWYGSQLTPPLRHAPAPSRGTPRSLS